MISETEAPYVEETASVLPSDDAGTEREIEDSEVSLEDSQGEGPFNPTQIRVSNKLYSLDSLMSRIEEDEIQLQPDFQRQAGIWSDGAKSRLIESLLVRIPLPAFYLDATDENRWRVIDGLQRLTTLKEFILDKTLRLRDLEITREFNGKKYDELPRTYQRRIRETQLTVVQIEAGTPEEAVFAIFQRINTGGLPLSSQEIRHALFQGKASLLLESLAKSQEFQTATHRSIRNSRMADREFVLRALAFIMTPYTAYQAEDLDGFLNKQMKTLNSSTDEENEDLSLRFKRALNYAHLLFGRQAFRKIMPWDKGLNPVNRALFEVWVVTLDGLSDQEVERLLENKKVLDYGLGGLMLHEEFYKSVSQATGNVRNVKKRFQCVEDLVSNVLAGKIVIPKGEE